MPPTVTERPTCTHSCFKWWRTCSNLIVPPSHVHKGLEVLPVLCGEHDTHWVPVGRAVSAFHRDCTHLDVLGPTAGAVNPKAHQQAPAAVVVEGLGGVVHHVLQAVLQRAPGTPPRIRALVDFDSPPATLPEGIHHSVGNPPGEVLPICIAGCTQPLAR